MLCRWMLRNEQSHGLSTFSLAFLTFGSTGCGQCQGVSGFNDTMPTWSGLQQADLPCHFFQGNLQRCPSLPFVAFRWGEIWQRQALQGETVFGEFKPARLEGELWNKFGVVKQMFIFSHENFLCVCFCAKDLILLNTFQADKDPLDVPQCSLALGLKHPPVVADPDVSPFE